MKHAIGVASIASILVLPTALSAQGIPVFDASGFAKQIEQLQHFMADLEQQVQMVNQLKQQYLTQLEQLTNIEGMFGAMTGVNELGKLYHSAVDIAARAEKLGDFDDFIDALRRGESLELADLFKNNGTVGSQWNAYKVDETLKSVGLSMAAMKKMTSSGRPEQEAVAAQAAVNTTAIAAADIAYDEARASLGRVDGLVEAIGDQATIKESVDLNTRMSGEVAYMMGQMWRLNAAEAMATGQNGINLASEVARQQQFFDFGEE